MFISLESDIHINFSPHPLLYKFTVEFDMEADISDYFKSGVVIALEHKCTVSGKEVCTSSSGKVESSHNDINSIPIHFATGGKRFVIHLTSTS